MSEANKTAIPAAPVLAPAPAKHHDGGSRILRLVLLGLSCVFAVSLWLFVTGKISLSRPHRPVAASAAESSGPDGLDWGEWLLGKKEGVMTSNDRAVDFLTRAGVFYLATVDGDRPQVRPFGAALNLRGRVSLCTGAWKNVAAQIRANGNVAVSAMTSDGRYIRISGRLDDATSAESRAAFFEARPELAELYKGKEDQFVVLSFAPGATATIADAKGNSETLRLD
ncbi:hypothetical protein FACS1894186_2560 [Alphaproteobacteria bacterium]|nr:hypothetical protein FACS1894186_2560 [Alphaproteobacteria bacterium]